ncbi:MAG: ftsY, partial [Frankiales bacterium]|nr:ftsY [Frankiales bacterium]
VVLVVALVVGLVLSRRRTVSLRPADGAAAEKPAPTKGKYTTGSSISFSSAPSNTAVLDRPTPPEPTGTPSWERTETDGQPGVGDDASVPRDSDRPELTDLELPTDLAPAPAPAAAPAPAPAPTTPVEATSGTGSTPVFAPVDRPARVERPAATPAVPTTGPDEIDSADGRLSRLRGRLSRTQNTFGRSMLGLLGAGDLDEDSWNDVEDTLLMADVGSGAASEIASKLRSEVAARGVASGAAARALLRTVMIEALDPTMDRTVKALPHDGRPSVVLVVGVNGTGKTTTTGKLARVLVASGHTVVLGAADTFRAAAADQLATWGDRAGAITVRGPAGSDPAAIAFEAVKRGIDTGADAVIIDTAGRLHTKTGLMDELGKVKRVIEKQAEVDEILLVLDATTGQNGMVQARVFADVVDITGIVLTKLDGTAKGGIVVAVQRALGVPVKLVGLGEGADDLAPFEPAAFVDALLGD